MSDEADMADPRMEAELYMLIQAARGELEVGKAGECIECGYHSERLIRYTCAPCRDYLKRIKDRRIYKDMS